MALTKATLRGTKTLFLAPLIALFLVYFGVFVPTNASAHAELGGNYEEFTIEVGFYFEPAYEGVENAVHVVLENNEGFAEDVLEPVSLQVDLTHVATDVSRVFDLVASQTPKQYVALFTPSTPGDYQFRVFGTVGEIEVDRTVVSGSEGFDSVEPSNVINFPEMVSTGRELTNLTISLDGEIQRLNRAIWGLVAGVLVLGAFLIGFSGLVYFKFSKPISTDQKKSKKPHTK